MTYQFTFTVFTPTYNRAHTLHRVYESLKKQTYTNFEWLIIDDGSTDNTAEMIEKWVSETKFPIRYICQENKGKYIAFNKAILLALGELFLTLDSDDACASNALEKFHYHWESIPSAAKNKFSAVTGLCVDQNGKLDGDKYPSDVFDSDSLETRYRYKIKGEKWGFQRTEVLKEHLFPVIDGEKFIPEGIVWNAIARKYKTRYINESLRIYWQDDTGKTKQLSKGNDPSRFALGQLLWCSSKLNDDIHWFKHAPVEFFRTAVHYSRFSFHTGKNIKTQFKDATNIISKTLWLITVLAGYLVFQKDKVKVRSLSSM